MVKFVEKLDFFSDFNVPDFEAQLKEEMNKVNYDQNKNNGLSNYSIIMDLLSSKTLFCSEEFLSKTKEALAEIQFYLNRKDFG